MTSGINDVMILELMTLGISTFNGRIMTPAELYEVRKSTVGRVGCVAMCYCKHMTESLCLYMCIYIYCTVVSLAISNIHLTYILTI